LRPAAQDGASCAGSIQDLGDVDKSDRQSKTLGASFLVHEAGRIGRYDVVGTRFLQISAPVQPGDSGGPLLDRHGDVVGVVVAKLDAVKIASATGDIPHQNVNFAIKASVAAAFLKANGVRQPLSFNDLSPALATPEIAAQAQVLRHKSSAPEPPTKSGRERLKLISEVISPAARL
jgi:hypothetical protein